MGVSPEADEDTYENEPFFRAYWPLGGSIKVKHCHFAFHVRRRSRGSSSAAAFRIPPLRLAW
jgi:hypothetical protein